jgi:hypothetical protein
VVVVLVVVVVGPLVVVVVGPLVVVVVVEQHGGRFCP